MPKIWLRIACGFLWLSVLSCGAQVSYAPITFPVKPQACFIPSNCNFPIAYTTPGGVMTSLIFPFYYDVLPGDVVLLEPVGDYAVGHISGGVLTFGPEMPQPLLGLVVPNNIGPDPTCDQMGSNGIQTAAPQFSSVPKAFEIPTGGTTICLPATGFALAFGSTVATNQRTRDADSNYGVQITPVQKIRFAAGGSGRIAMSATNVYPGQTFSLTLVLTNTGNVPAQNFTTFTPQLTVGNAPSFLAFLQVVSGPTPSVTSVAAGGTVTIQTVLKAIKPAANLYIETVPQYQFCDGSLGGGFFSYFTPLFKISGALQTTVTATPRHVDLGDPIQVVVSALNISTLTLTNVQVDGAITKAGVGGVSPATLVGAAVVASLAPGQQANFTNIYTATNFGKLSFTAGTVGSDSGVALQGEAATSGSVTIAPKGDLLLKRAGEPASAFVGGGIYQDVPAFPQVETNALGTDPTSGFQLLIVNNENQPLTFTLAATENHTNVWNFQYKLGAQDVTAQLESSSGAQLPPLAPGDSLTLDTTMSPTNATPGDLNGVVFTLGLASDPTLTLDAVEAFTQLIPDGDLLIKRDADPPSHYGGQGIFQAVPAFPQMATNVVALNQVSKFQVQIQNTTTQAQSFALAAQPSGNGGWTNTYLLGTQDMTAQLEAPGGASLPQLAPSNSLTLEVIMRATNAPSGDIKRIAFTLALASSATRTLDAVEAVSQVGPPDLAVVSMAWNNTNSGLDFVYTNRGSALTNAALAQVYWASGPTTNDILNLQPIYTAHIPTGFSGQATNQVPELYFDFPPTNATYVQVLLDPDNSVTETTRTNNALALPLTFRHVVLVMMENRSFDHFLGWLHGADGKQAGLVFTNALGQAYPTYDLAPYYQGCGCLLPDQVFGAYTEFNNGLCDGWLRANTNDTYTIGYYSQADLPFWGQVAPNWTVCDRYFAPLMAETQPNRIYQHAAQTDCLSNRNFSATISGTLGISPITLPTIWDTLNQSNVSGYYYHEGIGPQQTILTLWGISKYNNIVKPIRDFYGACVSGTLPSVSYVDPFFTAPSWAAVTTGALNIPGYDTQGNDYHPHADIRNGEAFLERVYNAIASSPQWSSTVLIINFDEWGGFYDHVAPPIGPVTPEEYNLGNQGQLGFRVPCMIISPWAKRATVDHMQFDHTSVLKLIEDRWGLPALARRDQAANDLTNVLDFATPPNYAIPAINPYALTNAPFGGFCQEIQLATQPNGTLAAVWDATCLKVILQTAPTINTPDGLWSDQPNILTPPYVFTPLAGSGRTQFIRLKVLGSGYVTPPL